jgi:chlorobactene glucosyltransferase
VLIFSFIILTIVVTLFFGVTMNVFFWEKIGVADTPLKQTISILVPARNEETNLATCLDAALRQNDNVVEVLVYDDHSIDATRQIILDYANRDLRVRLVEPSPLPAGWCGKPFACYQLAQVAKGDWLLFLDADARLGENVAARILAEAQHRKLTFLSCWTGLEMVSFWEKTLMPMLNFVVLTIFPATLSDKRMDEIFGIAHGACILTHRQTYSQIGGHALVKDQLFEDVRLAQKWRAKGERGLCLDGQEVVRTRMYLSFAEIWRGFQKNFFPAFRHESSFWLFLIFHFICFFLSFVLLPFAAFGLLSKTYLLIVAIVLTMRLLLALRFRQPLWSVLLHPLAEAILLARGIASWWQCKSGAGVEWKGRNYLSNE